MPEAPLYPRYVERQLMEALADSPVVLIQGPRQSGKTTLARRGRARGYAYLSFDDDVASAAAATGGKASRRLDRLGRCAHPAAAVQPRR